MTIALWKDSEVTPLSNSFGQPLSLHQIIQTGLNSEELEPSDRRIADSLHFGEGDTLSTIFGRSFAYWVISRRNESC